MTSTKQSNSRRLCTRKGIASYLRISRMQLYRWSKINPLPLFFIGWGNKNWKQDSWTTDDADAWKTETLLKHRSRSLGYSYKMYR